MTVSWDQLPLNLRTAIVREMDVGTRVNLSMCSKSENQLVRGTMHGKVGSITLKSNELVIMFEHKRENTDRLRVLVKPGEDGGSKVHVHHQMWPAHNEFEKYSTTNDWKETVMNIMSLIGTSVKVKTLELETGRNFKETFKWLRDNVQLNPNTAGISVHSLPDYYDESLWDWPSHTKFDLTLHCCRLSNLKRFNNYDKVVSFNYFGADRVETENTVGDEDIKKFRNLERVTMDCSNVTVDGVIWWFEQWMTRTNDKEDFLFFMWFKRGHEISFENLTNALSGFIEGIERCSQGDFGFSEDHWKIHIKKDEKSGGTIRLSNYRIRFDDNVSTA